MRETGIKYHVAMTCTAYEACVSLAGCVPSEQSETGRMWDVLYLFSCAARRCTSEEMTFTVNVARVTENGRATEEITLKAVIGPGDDPKPVIPMMMPDEDRGWIPPSETTKPLRESVMTT